MTFTYDILKTPFGGDILVTPQPASWPGTELTFTLSGWRSYGRVDNSTIKYRIWASSLTDGTDIIEQMTDDWLPASQSFVTLPINTNPV